MGASMMPVGDVLIAVMGIAGGIDRVAEGKPGRERAVLRVDAGRVIEHGVRLRPRGTLGRAVVKGNSAQRKNQ